MDSDKRRALELKRTLAALRRERAQETRIFREVAPTLCEAGVRFSRIPSSVCRRALAPLDLVPGKDERLDWSYVPGALCTGWGNLSEAVSILATAMDSVDAVRVQVIFHPALSGLRIKAQDLVQHAKLILGAAYDTLWILPTFEGDWFMEVALLDQEVCVAPHGRPAQWANNDPRS